jgi:hypothetical protein
LCLDLWKFSSKWLMTIFFNFMLLNQKFFLQLFPKIWRKYYYIILFHHFCRFINSEEKMFVLYACRVNGSCSEINGRKMWNNSLPKIVLFVHKESDVVYHLYHWLFHQVLCQFFFPFSLHFFLGFICGHSCVILIHSFIYYAFC